MTCPMVTRYTCGAPCAASKPKRPKMPWGQRRTGLDVAAKAAAAAAADVMGARLGNLADNLVMLF
jgi:hypothetical protein